jgi:hypothetical protein
MNIALFADVHGRVLLCFALCARWQHGIPARKSDLHNGRRVQRGRRVSLTFRTVVLQAV